MNHATVANAGYGGLVQRWLFVLLAIMMSLMVASPAMARRANGGLAGGVFVPPVGAPASMPPQFDLTGFLESATVDPTMCPAVADARLKGGTAKINGQTFIVPCNTVLQMPAFALTWADLWTMAPKDIMPLGSTASGLALSDVMAPGALGLLNTPWTDPTTGLPTSYSAPLPSHEFHVVGNVINGQYIAGLIFISQQSLNGGQGVISCIDYATGEMQVGGTPLPVGSACPTPAALAASGQKVTRVRMNDPIGRFGIVHGGPGSVGADVIEPGYDPRFTADTDNPTMHASTGYPVCIPSINPVNSFTDPITGTTVAAGIDPLCPMYNRPIVPNCKSHDPLTGLPAFGGQPPGFCTQWVMDPPGLHAPTSTATDPTVNAPLANGDTILFSGTMKADANGPYISAHTIEANLGIYTHPHTQPSYVFMEGVIVGTGGGTVGGVAIESTTKVAWGGFTTDPTELVDFYAMHQDPATGAPTEYYLGTQDPCCRPLGRFRTPVNNLGVFGEPQRIYRAVSRTMCQPAWPTRSAHAGDSDALLYGSCGDSGPDRNERFDRVESERARRGPVHLAQFRVHLCREPRHWRADNSGQLPGPAIPVLRFRPDCRTWHVGGRAARSGPLGVADGGPDFPLDPVSGCARCWHWRDSRWRRAAWAEARGHQLGHGGLGHRHSRLAYDRGTYRHGDGPEHARKHVLCVDGTGRSRHVLRRLRT